MQSLAQPAAPPSAEAAPTAEAGATPAPVGLPGLGTSNLTTQLWLSEVKARLQSYKEYPSSAIATMQQDTVMLRFSVDRAGQVTYSRIDSSHHYQALEQEVQKMLRLAAPLPTPPPQLPVKRMVVTVPVQFNLLFKYCSGSTCRTVSGVDSAKAAKLKLRVLPTLPPTLASCVAPANPGPAPVGSAATLEQMRAYRERLDQYLAASGNQLACLSQVPGAVALAARNVLTQGLHRLVGDFNAQAQLFQSKAQAEALQAQQARQRQTQALAAQINAACTRPRVLPAPGALTAGGARSFRRQLIGYQSAVRSYVACLRQADLAAAAPERALGDDQRAQLEQSALQLGNAAILSFNQLVGRFNTQVPRLRQQALAAREQTLAEAVVRGTAIFPSSTWDLPVPLPTDECIAIIEFGQTYHAQLCNPTYVTTVSDLSQQLKNNVNKPDLSAGEVMTKAVVDMAAQAASALPPEALQQEAIAAQHGFPADGNPRCKSQYCPPPILGIAVTTQAGFAQQVQPAGPVQQTISYSVSELQVAGRHISMTISRRSDQDAGKDDLSAVHFDLALSPDNQTLHGYCWTGQQRRECTLSRHPSVSSPENSRH